MHRETSGYRLQAGSVPRPERNAYDRRGASGYGEEEWSSLPYREQKSYYYERTVASYRATAGRRTDAMYVDEGFRASVFGLYLFILA